MTSIREFKNSGVTQGADEKVAYYTDTTPWGGSTLTPPTNPVVKLYDVTGGAKVDVTASKCQGAASISGIKVIYPLIQQLVVGNQYRVEVAFEIGGNSLEAFGKIVGEE
jgi:hypothetical protein